MRSKSAGSTTGSKAKPRRGADSRRLGVFVMGANKWRDEQQWPLSRAKPRVLFLDERR